MIKSMILSMLSVALLAVGVGNAVAQTPDPPPLSEQPAQNTFDVHISPAQCTELHGADGPECIETGERWRCPVGLKPSAVFRTSSDLSYNETIGPWPPLRDTHCLFVGHEKAVPVAPYDSDRPVISCYTRYTNGDIETGLCQTVQYVVPVPTATPAPTPTAVPVAAPVPAFTG